MIPAAADMVGKNLSGTSYTPVEDGQLDVPPPSLIARRYWPKFRCISGLRRP